ncbi:Uncharacterized protein APZ42_017076 [Daphnia magna]|uniref:Uncharacterized protein n=1 Tax=Daphnia magna TaxID=35525 RepID=A0A165A1L2_9CRUS|nr:Uncharacterized protein APZ42_017076 [Daphnia magna]
MKTENDEVSLYTTTRTEMKRESEKRAGGVDTTNRHSLTRHSLWLTIRYTSFARGTYGHKSDGMVLLLV